MTIFIDKVKEFQPRLLKDLDLKPWHGFGIWGNVGGETGGFKYLQEQKPVIAGSAGGWGWLQWTGPRRRKMTAWCRANNLDPASDEANYRYLIHETLTDEKASLDALKKTTTIKAATETFCMKNLRPGVPHIEGRLGWAQKAADAFKYVEGSQVAPEKQCTSEAPKPIQTGSKIGAGAGAGAGMVGTTLLYHYGLVALPWLVGAAILGAVIYFLIRKHNA